MSSKISDLPVAGSFGSTDVLLGLVGGADVQVPKTLLPGGGGAVSFPIGDGGGSIDIDGSGAVTINAAAGQAMILQQGGSGWASIGATGQVDIASPAGMAVQLQAGGSFFAMMPDGSIQISLAGGVVMQFPYTVGNPGDWAGSPTDLALAVDRIAAVVSGGGATPIP